MATIPEVQAIAIAIEVAVIHNWSDQEIAELVDTTRFDGLTEDEMDWLLVEIFYTDDCLFCRRW